MTLAAPPFAMAARASVARLSSVFNSVRIGVQTDAGLHAIPGGGLRGESSHLIERYQLADQARKLHANFTWIDDKVFAKPSTYTFMYEELPRSTMAREWLCDPEGRGAGSFPDRFASGR